MTTITVRPSGQEELRTAAKRLLGQFKRFGVSASTPEVIEGEDSVLTESVVDARQRLVNLIENDPRVPRLDSLGESELEGLLLEMVRLSIEGRLHPFLADAGVPYPVYNFFAGFAENAHGPWDAMPDPLDLPEATDWRLLGQPVRVPIGVPASGLTANSRWIAYFARRGFNVLTYKTVRSRRHSPHRYPHWVVSEDGEPWRSLDEVGLVRGDLSTWPKDLLRFSTANSFGVPSPAPEVWQADVLRTRSLLLPGQLLILSVMGTAEPGTGPHQLIQDFVVVARMGEDTGVDAIELNLSCPNTVSSDGQHMSLPLCCDAEATEQVVRAVRAALKPTTRLVAKLTYLRPADLTAVLERIAPLVDAISGINTIQAPILRTDADVSPFIGTSSDPSHPREAAGVSGHRIQTLGLDFVAQAAAFRDKSGLEFDIIGMGGVIDAGDVMAYTQSGADAVQTATGACLYPQLPLVVAEEPTAFAPVRSAVGLEPRSTGLRRVARALSTGGLSLVLDRGDS